MVDGAFVASGGEFLVNTTTTGVQTDAAITALAGGGFVVTWTDASATGADTSGTAIRAQIYDAAGVRVGGEFVANAATANAQSQSTVTALANGGFVVSWADASGVGDTDGLSIKARIFDANGVAPGGDFLVNTNTRLNQTNPTITSLANGGFVVSWTDASGVGDTKGTGIKAQIYAAGGTRVGSEFLVNTTTANSQTYSSIVGLAGGGFVVTWVDSSGLGGDPTSPSVKAQLYGATGARVGTEFLVNTTTAAAQDQPVVTALANGGFVVSWRDTSLQGDTSASGVKAQVYSAAGARIGAEFQVNTTTLNTQDQVALSALPGGGFVATWRDNSLLSSDAAGFAVRAQVFDATGGKVGGEWVVNSATAGNQEMPTVTTLASGAIVLAWSDGSGTGGDGDGSIKAQIFSPTQAAITGLTLSTGQVSEAAVGNVAVGLLQASGGAVNASYGYTIVDDSTGGAFAIDGASLMVKNSLLLDYEAAQSATLTIRATDTFGNGFDQIYTLGITDSMIEHRFAGGTETTANSATANNQQQSAIAALASGRYVVVWSDASGTTDLSSYGIKAQIVDATGAKVGGEFLVNTQTLNSQDLPAVTALASGGFVVTWEDASASGGDTSGYGIKAQMYDATGMAMGGELLVNQSTLNAQKMPAISALASGGFVVTWSDLSLQGGDASGSSVKAQIYDAAGARVGTEFLVNTNTATGQDMPVVAGLASGGFVVSWRDSSGIGGDSSKDAIKAQIYDASGARTGTEFLVNTQTRGNQQQEAIAALPDGGFVVTWADGSNIGGDADNYGIKAQIYDASGTRVGGEMLVNTTTAGIQIAPSVSTLANGDFVISWSDYSGAASEGGTPGIKAQVFAQDGTRIGGEFLANGTLPGSQVEPAVAGGSDGGFAIVWTDASGIGNDASGTSVKLKTFSRQADQGGPPPVVASADAVAGTEDQALVIDPAILLANDTDAAGSPLAITAVKAVTGGSVRIQNDGTILFTPFADFNGTALFGYTASDGANSATGRVTVTLAAVNDAPVARDDAVALSQNGGTIAASLLLANDSDVDAGDRLTIAGMSAITTLGASLALAQGNATYDPGTMFQSLAAGQVAVDTFGYIVTDSAGATATATATLTITGIDDAPTGLVLSNARVDENAVNGTLVGTFQVSDVDQGDTLTYALTDTAGGRFAVDAVTGALTVANGTLLDYEKQAAYTLAARVTDSGGLATTASVTIQLNNLPEARSWTGDNGANAFTASTNDFWTITGLGGADVLTGNASADTIYGGSGADTLDGAGGADTLVGGIGDDTYYVDDAGDQVIENAGEGTDLVYASTNYTLSANVEKLTQTGAADLTVTGNDLANTITGNAGNTVMHGGGGGDLLMGNDGNDLLWGDAGGDYLQGGNGDDVLIGGAGADQLTGGAGADTFVLDTLTVSSDFDTIKDFTAGQDMLSLSSTAFAALAGGAGAALSAANFRSGAGAGTATQYVIYNPSTGNLYYDADGSGAGAQVQIGYLAGKPALTAANFFVT